MISNTQILVWHEISCANARKEKGISEWLPEE